MNGFSSFVDIAVELAENPFEIGFFRLVFEIFVVNKFFESIGVALGR